MKLQVEMTREELIEFFSMTKEFTVTPSLDNDGVEIADTYDLQCGGKSLKMYKPTMQTLIRLIYQLGGL